MTARQTLTPQRFLERFFGPGNQLSLENQKQAKILQVWTRRVLERKDRILLPRKENEQITWYALSDTARNARALREELLAAVGSSYTDFYGISADLRRSDPVEAAVLDYVGRHAFKLAVVDPDQKNACRNALARMLELHDGRPPSRVHAARSPGLILRDLELALQQWDRQAADTAIEELRAGGYLDGRNLRFLEIRRLEAFGEWVAIREELEEGTILELRRPVRITQALLRGLYQVELAGFELGVRASEALAHFQGALAARFATLLETREGMAAPEVAKLFMLKAVATQDARLRDSVLEGSALRGADKAYLKALADLVQSSDAVSQPLRDDAVEAYLDGDKDRAFELLVAGGGGSRRVALLLRCARDLGTLRVAEIALGEVDKLPASVRKALQTDPRLTRQLQELEERYTTPALGVPKGWLDWVKLVSEGALDDNKAAELAQQGAEEWSLDQLVSRPGDVAELAEAVLGVGEKGKQQLQFALPHLQGFLMQGGVSSPPLKPILRSLLELNAFDNERSGGTWRAATEVLEGLVRCGLSEDEYSDAVDLLEILLGEGLPLELVDEALDLLETLVLLTPGHAETNRAASLVHDCLQRWWERLERMQIELFNQLGRELGTGAVLPLPKEEEQKEEEATGFARLKGKVVALYSLNERALARVKAILEAAVDDVRVLTFSDKVGGQSLRTAARTADVFLVVTGAAKHAATEFIEANRGAGLTTLRTHAKGSASLLRLLRAPFPSES